MKNYQILDLNQKLGQYSQQLKSLKGAKFAYTIVKNATILSDEFKTISSLVEATDRYKEYETKRISLCEQFAQKDQNGQAIKKQLGGDRFEYVIDMENPAWKGAMDSLQAEYKDELDQYSQRISDYNNFLLQDTNVVFTKMNFEDIPSDISVELMAVIEPFIN